MRLEKYSPW
ncbi:hypothetical protein LINPERHAP1_LOCUS4207 [Linum perenne]